MAVPGGGFTVCGERFVAAYRLSGGEGEARARVDDICVEQDHRKSPLGISGAKATDGDRRHQKHWGHRVERFGTETWRKCSLVRFAHFWPSRRGHRASRRGERNYLAEVRPLAAGPCSTIDPADTRRIYAGTWTSGILVSAETGGE